MRVKSNSNVDLGEWKLPVPDNVALYSGYFGGLLSVVLMVFVSPLFVIPLVFSIRAWTIAEANIKMKALFEDMYGSLGDVIDSLFEKAAKTNKMESMEDRAYKADKPSAKDLKESIVNRAAMEKEASEGMPEIMGFGYGNDGDSKDALKEFEKQDDLEDFEGDYDNKMDEEEEERARLFMEAMMTENCGSNKKGRGGIAS